MNAQLQEKEVNQIVEYGVTDAAIAQLKEKFKEVPDASTKEGYALIKTGLSEMRPLRTGIETKRKELKAESLAWGKKVDTEAKRITSELISIEQPYKDAKQFQDDEDERVKQEAIEKEQARISAIEMQIDKLKNLDDLLISASSEEIQSRLDEAKNILNTGDFQEFIEPAKMAFDKIRSVLEDAIRDRIFLEAQQAEQAERQKVMDEQQAELDAKQAVIDQQEAAQKQKEHNEQIAKEAEERATKAAELKAEQEKEAAAQREANLKAKAEQAELEAKETEQRLKDEAEAKIKQEAAEAEAREKDKKHKASINNAAIDALVAGGMNKTNAKQAVTLIAKRLIPNVVISY